jgi:hypothetical protein
MSNTQTKDFDPAVLASLTSGIVLVEEGFSPIHEAAEWVLGHPVWTHHFADKALWERMAAALLAQLPDLPTDKTDVQGRWQDVRDQMRARYGERVSVRRGRGESAPSPFDGIPDGMPVIAVAT